jgi:hypothetical protein
MNHTEELKTFMYIHNIDIMLISETHFSEKKKKKKKKLSKPSQLYSLSYKPSSWTCLRWYCHNNNNSVKHHQLNNYTQNSLQATSVSLKDSVSLLTILAVCLPPRYTVKQEQLEVLSLWGAAYCVIYVYYMNI